MLRAIIFCVAIAILVAVAYWFAENPGSVVIQWREMIVETEVGILVLAAAAVALLFTIFYNTLRYLMRAPGRWRRSWRLRRRERGYRALTLGMVAVAAGDADEARRQARRADVLLDEPPLTMLLAAQTAQLDGDDTAARRYFEQMLDRPETAFLGLRGLLVQAQRAGDTTRALEIAERASRLRPGTPWVLDALFDLQARTAKWGDAERTLESMLRHKLLTREDANHRRAVLRTERSRAAEARGDGERALQLAREAHRLDPMLAPAAAEVDRLQAAAGNPRRAEKAILEGWASNPHPSLAKDFAALYRDQSPADRYRRFERLARANPDHRETHYALAEAAIEANLWSEAREHLKRASESGLTARVCRLMAEVETSERGDADAARTWLERAAEAEPDPTWVCGNCGNTTGEWSATCPACSAFDTLAWRAPSRTAPVTLRGMLVTTDPTFDAAPGQSVANASSTPTAVVEPTRDKDPAAVTGS